MSVLRRMFLSTAALATMSSPGQVSADGAAFSTVAVGGHDPVSYHNGKKPLRGNGNHVVVHDGVTYLFANDRNKETFAAAPEKYVPAYGGYCAFGVSVGKKFFGDPDVWKIVDGRLYLNLDTGIQEKWLEDVPGNIEKADSKWPAIEERLPSEL